MEIRKRRPKQWHDIYDKRTIVQGLYAHIKEQLGLERNFKKKVIEAVETYTNLMWIAKIASALTIVQNETYRNLLRANQRELF